MSSKVRPLPRRPEQEDGATTGPKRVNVNFSEDTFRIIENLARKRGMTVSDVIREAILLEKWFNEMEDEGGRILVERDGKFRELMRLR
jgi:hypothetical protein